mmetsp:Transcript_10565/g.23422  ORF Transcript_10565/g.23422 Transcript_10565/m.23422 type:complete len:203 (-) Transcript_10565:380-988(-)
MARVRPINAGKARSTVPFDWGVPGAVNSNLMPKPSALQRFTNSLFSPELSRRTHLIAISCLAFKSLTQSTNRLYWSDFRPMNQLFLKPDASSTANNQCLLPPRLLVFIEEMSKKIRPPGSVALLCDSFGITFFRIFSSAQLRHGRNVPDSSTPIALAVILLTSCPQCPRSWCIFCRVILLPLEVMAFTWLNNRFIFTPSRKD